ncbi:B12-binding domain-containing radical SAM protein [Jatrophihabitans sp.]|uniref:B12-binding domain-containing radical SAM protein n=1 Tax=Jatrophihabitans sp. TaxID=1932789 RepID=UPI0038CD849D
MDSYARARGHPGADLIDTNIEAFHFSYSAAGIDWMHQCLRSQDISDGRPYQSEDTVRASLLRVAEPDPAAVRRAATVLRDPGLFYDYGYYQQAVNDVTAWMNCLGSTGFAGQFHNGFEARLPTAFAIGSRAALTDVRALARLNRPFQCYYDDVLLPRLRAGSYDIVGINITYAWQLPFALWLSRLIRQSLPSAFVIAGGTEVSDVWKYAQEKATVFEIFHDLDAIVIGEGETAYTSILECIGAGTLPTSHPNVRLHPRYGAPRPLTLLHYEPLHDLPVPDYHGLPWDLYLSPERFVYYSPTRGCYWNKCTFCDYGLNTEGPTSPWRQDHVDTMMRDVTAISAFAKFIYFSVDVLAPATILRFAERVVEEQLDIRWGAEIRLEKYWSAERAEVLRRSGCVAVSVGFESGNQRILDLIDKGTRPIQVRQTISAMHGAGIGVQMMGFTGFPTESLIEARDSVDFLVDNRELWTFGGLGEFQLTSGAIVAKQPGRFGVSNIRAIPGSDIARMLLFDEPISQEARPEAAKEKRRIAPGGHYERPWLGGTDTPHSFFFHDRFGTGVRSVLHDARSVGVEDLDRFFVLNGELIPAPPEAVQHSYQALYGDPTTQIDMSRLAFRRADGAILLLPERLKMFLEVFTMPVTLRAARERAWMVDDASVTQLWLSLARQGIIRRVLDPADIRPPSGQADLDNRQPAGVP